ncbi:hypothetical protein BX600DRAFT_530854 [Xylariales sp. PMI_506]|nr:hypothetical protein BX600DRAFT_530854 [Xylariales sp. PMI_506]
MLRSTITAYFVLSLLGAAVASPFELWERSVENGQCTGAGGAPAGGSYISNACPGTPNDVKCCTKPTCGSGGNCRWTSQCASGNTISNQCPGPSNFKCCLPASSGGSSSSSNVGAKVLAKAETAEGTPYVFGGGSCSGKTSGGFDCSGLVSWAVCQVTGRNLFSEGLRVTHEMYCASSSALKYSKIPYSQRRAGDAVFFGGNGCDCAKDRDGIHHVGLMMNSGTKMWNALKTGTNVRSDDFGGWSGTNSPCPC